MKVVAAHGSRMVAEGLALLLETQPGVDEVVVATTTDECLALSTDVRVELTVVDTALCGRSTPSLCRQLRERGVAVCVISRLDDPDHVALLESGVSALLMADDDGARGLADAVAAVRTGDAYVTPRLLGHLLRGLIVREREHAPSSGVDRLSPREREVLGLLAAGEDDRGIARALSISPHTAKTHVTRLLGKLDVRSRVEAAAIGLEHGLAHQPTAPPQEARP